MKKKKKKKKKKIKKNVKWKGYENSFNSWIDKKRHSISEQIFSRTKIFRGKVKAELDLSNYATKTDLKNVTLTDHPLLKRLIWLL